MNAIKTLALVAAIAVGAAGATAQSRPHLGNQAEQKRAGITYHQNEERPNYDPSWAVRSQIFHQDPRAAQGELVGLTYTDYRPNYYDPKIGLCVHPRHVNQAVTGGNNAMTSEVKTRSNIQTTKMFDRSMPAPPRGTIISDLPTGVQRVDRNGDVYFIANSYILKEIEIGEETRYIVE